MPDQSHSPDTAPPDARALAGELQHSLNAIAEKFPAARLLVDLARDAGFDALKQMAAEVRHLTHQLERTERRREKLHDRLHELLYDLSTGPIHFPQLAGKHPRPDDLVPAFRQFRDEEFPAVARRVLAAAERGEVAGYQILLVEEILLKGCNTLVEYLVRHAADEPPASPDEEFLGALRLHIAGQINQTLARDVNYQVTPEVGAHVDKLIARSLAWLQELLSSSPPARLLVPRPGERYNLVRHERVSKRGSHSERAVRSLLFPGLSLPGSPLVVLEKAVVHTDRIAPAQPDTRRPIADAD